MNESERESAFPVHINLGTKGLGGLAVPEVKPEERTHYPTLYISGVKGLEKMPPNGCMLVDYEVVGFHKSKGGPGSIEIECKTICLQHDESAEDEESEHDNAGSIIDEMARKAGILKEGEEE